jgi:hypothetical protein
VEEVEREAKQVSSLEQIQWDWMVAKSERGQEVVLEVTEVASQSTHAHDDRTPSEQKF